MDRCTRRTISLLIPPCSTVDCSWPTASARRFVCMPSCYLDADRPTVFFSISDLAVERGVQVGSTRERVVEQITKPILFCSRLYYSKFRWIFPAYLHAAPYFWPFAKRPFRHIFYLSYSDETRKRRSHCVGKTLRCGRLSAHAAPDSTASEEDYVALRGVRQRRLRQRARGLGVR